MASRYVALILTCLSLLAVPATAAAKTTDASTLPCVTTGVVPPIGDCTPSPPKADPCGAVSVLPTAANLADVRKATLCLLNKERTSRRLAALTSNGALQKAATSYSLKMVDEGFFDHVSPGGSTLTSRIKGTSFLAGPLRSWTLGENIAWGSGGLATPERIVDAWMHSAGHRKNILTPGFKVIGIGIAPGAPTGSDISDAATYTTDFGARS